MTCTKNGVLVKLINYNIYIMADVYEVAGAVVVRGNRDLDHCGFRTIPDALRGQYCCSLVAEPSSGFWRNDLGVWVVPSEQLQGWSEIRPEPEAVL